MKCIFNTKVEFAVQMSGAGCAEKVQQCLKDVGTVNIDIPSGRVIVNSSLPWIEIQEKIEKTGRRAVLSGFGGYFNLRFVHTQQTFYIVFHFCLQKNLLLLSYQMTQTE